MTRITTDFPLDSLDDLMKMVTDNFSSVVTREVHGIPNPIFHELPWGPEQQRVSRLCHPVNMDPYYLLASCGYSNCNGFPDVVSAMGFT